MVNRVSATTVDRRFGREGPQGTAPEPDPALPIPKVPPGWDQPYRVVNGAPRPAGRYPKLLDGRPWPTAQAEEM